MECLKEAALALFCSFFMHQSHLKLLASTYQTHMDMQMIHNYICLFVLIRKIVRMKL